MHTCSPALRSGGRKIGPNSRPSWSTQEVLGLARAPRELQPQQKGGKGERARKEPNTCFYFLQIYGVKCPDLFQILLPHTHSTLAFGKDAKLASRQRGFPRYVSTASLSPTTADNCALATHNEGFPRLAFRFST